MTSNALAALILGNLIKIHVAREIVAMLSSGNVLAPFEGQACQFKIRVYGDTKEELIENRKRCRDAANVFGVALKNRKQTKSGATILGIPFENDPFNQIKHYFAEMIVTYHE